MIQDLISKTRKSIEMKPIIEFCEVNEIFDPTQTLKSTRVIDNRPVLE